MTLVPSEREIVITIADDEEALHVFTDSKRALSRRLTKVAEAIGAEVTSCGEGIEFCLPINALSARVPKRRERTAAQKAASVAAGRRLAASHRTPVLTP